MVTFVYVCLEVVGFFVMFPCWDFVEPIRYGVCDVYVGWGSVCCQWFLHFASCYAISLPEILMCALTSCIVMLCLVQRVWWILVEINNLLGWLW